MTKTLNKSYVCPNCNGVQYSILKSVTTSVIFEFSLSSRFWAETDRVYGEIEDFICPDCRQNISIDFGLGVTANEP
jgi:acetone carboxylase gamma subunit